MQKIFVGNKPIILTTQVEKETDFKNLLIDSVSIEKILSVLKKDKYKAVHLIGSDLDSMLKTFLKFLPSRLRHRFWAPKVPTGDRTGKGPATPGTPPLEIIIE